MPIPLELGRAACAEPEHLPLVDAAFAKPGGPEAQEMKRTLCRHCPVLEACATWAMTHPEHGIWGATSPKYRTRHAAPSTRTATPQTRTPYRPTAAATRCAELGIRESDVRRWAHEQGMVTTTRGRASIGHVEAWAAAHRQVA